MIAEIGLTTLLFAFFASIFAVIASAFGEARHRDNLVLSGRNAALLTFPLLIISTGALLFALLTEQYQISYVSSVSDPSTPFFYRVTALWGSQRGSLLFWCLLMSAFTFGTIWLDWKSDRRLMPYAIAFMMATLAFFIGITLFLENPFDRYWVVNPNTEAQALVETAFIPENAVPPAPSWLAENAQGLNPLLRHFGMIIHPPMLYLGFVGFVVPFAFAMAALASGDLSTNWIKATRRWSLVSWLFLSLGLILGGRWAYDVLGWGGYWGWDPVENAAFLPWLVGTAFLHSVMIQQKRGMLKVWNMVLVIGTFSAVLFGTFATRSGVIESVHSFARSEIGFPMLFFWASMTLIGTALIIWRWQRGELRDERGFAGLLSRESLFVLNNVIFMALTVVIFWGSFGAPIVSELFLDTEITIGAEYFLLVTPPLFAALYLLMGIAPLSAWSATTIKKSESSVIIPMALVVVSLVILLFQPPLGAVALLLSFAWLVLSNRKVRDSILIPAALTAGTLVILGLFSPSTVASLTGYGLVFLAGYVAIWETYRGAAARVRGRGENWWQATRALFGRNQRRYGGYIVHLGITVIGIGVIGSTLFQYETRRTIGLGETITVQEYAVRYDHFERGIAADGRGLNVATLTLLQNDREIATLRPRIDQYPDMSMTIAGAHSTLERDFYVLLNGFDQGEQVAVFRIYINPLVNLVWWGGLILILGTMIAAWPKDIVPAHLRERKEQG